jgi:hypothetical protein
MHDRIRVERQVEFLELFTRREPEAPLPAGEGGGRLGA